MARLNDHHQAVIARAIKALTDAGLINWTENAGTPEAEFTVSIVSTYPHVVLEITSEDRTARFRVPAELESFFERLNESTTGD